MRLLLGYSFIVLLLAGEAFCEDACHPTSGMTIRVRAPENTITSLSWEGSTSDCSYSGQDLAIITVGGAARLTIPDREFNGVNSGPITITATGDRPELTQNIVVSLVKTVPETSPRLYFYYDSYPNSEASIEQMRLFEQSQKIYQNFYLARKLVHEGANTNITATATYFYYQSAILIEPSEFSKGSMKLSDEARTLMRNLLNTLADPADPEHDPTSDAIKHNYARLIRPLSDLRRELGLPSTER